MAPFLPDRSSMVYVAVCNSRSDTWICHEGVPQGSVLGPLLFSSYVSPIARIFDRFDVIYHQYADDIQLYTAVRSSEDISRLLMCFGEVTRWFLIRGLLLNASKTEAIAFGTRQQLVKRSTDTSSGVARQLCARGRAMKLVPHAPSLFFQISKFSFEILEFKF